MRNSRGDFLTPDANGTNDMHCKKDEHFALRIKATRSNKERDDGSAFTQLVDRSSSTRYANAMHLALTRK
jgi:hypothetical protein